MEIHPRGDCVKSEIIFSGDISKLSERWNYDLLSPFFSIRRNGNKLEIQRNGCHEEDQSINDSPINDLYGSD